MAWLNRGNHPKKATLRCTYLHVPVDGRFFEAVHKALAWEHTVEIPEHIHVLLYQKVDEIVSCEGTW